MGEMKRLRRSTSPQKDVVKTDHLSQLPDEVICNILSQPELSLFDAYRTNVLSRRWENLWLFRYTIGPNLIFSDDYKQLWISLRLVPRRRKDWPSSLVDRKRRMFTSLLNKVLMSYNKSVLNEFVVNFYLNSKFSSSIDEWILFGLSKGVKRLHLDFSPSIPFLEWETPYSFPSTFPSSAILLLHNLTDVSLKHMIIHQVSVDALLSACLSLDRLSLQPENEVRLTITSHNIITKKIRLKLKHLELHLCPSEHHDVLVFAPNLISLSYTGRVRSLRLYAVPLLSEFCVKDLDFQHFLKTVDPFFSYLFRLKKLNLFFSLRMVQGSTSYPMSFPEFPKLEQLEVTVEGFYDHSFLWLTLLIKASPVLHRFSLNSMVTGLNEGEHSEKSGHPEIDQRRIKEATKFSHQTLKVVEISVFKGLSCEIEFVQHLFNIGAQSLEKAVIDTRARRLNQENSRKLAQSLGKRLDPRVQFVVL